MSQKQNTIRETSATINDYCPTGVGKAKGAVVVNDWEELSDRELVGMYRDTRDPTLLAAFYDRHCALVETIVQSWADSKHDAEDLAHGAWVVVITQFAARRIDNPVAYLRKATQQHCYNVVVRERRRPELERQASQPQIVMIEHVPAVVVVSAGLAKLSKTDRELITWVHLDGDKSAEVAERIGVSPAAVRQRLGRAVKNFRRGIT